MATDVAPNPTALAWRSLPLARWLVLALLLVIEVGASPFVLTAKPWRKSSPWAWAIVLAHHLPGLALAILTAVILFAGKHLAASLRHDACMVHQPFPWWTLTVHLAALAAFFQVTALVMEGGLSQLGHPAFWSATWFGLGRLSLMLWALTILPAGVWLRLIGQNPQPLLAGSAIGIGGWVMGHWADNLAGLLEQTTFWLVHQLLRPIFPNLVCEPANSLLATENFFIYISPMCAGYEGIGLIAVFLAAYLWLFRGNLRFPLALLLLPLGTIAIYLVNAVRIAALVVVGEYVSPEVALGGFHSQAGWLGFNAVALGLVMLTGHLSWFTKAEALPKSAAANLSAAYLVPLLALVTANMLTAAFGVGGFDSYYPLRVLVVGCALWWYRGAYRPLLSNWSWRPVFLGAAVFVLWLALSHWPVTLRRKTAWLRA